MLKSLMSLLPPGSLFARPGKYIMALLVAIAWQFQVVKDTYRLAFGQTNPLTSTTLEILAREYNIDLGQLKEGQARILLNFVKHNPLDMTQEKFFIAFRSMFPRVTIYATSASILGYEWGQCGVFTAGASESSGYIHSAVGSDAVYIQGVVDSYQQMRFLKWFLERYDRAKHKHNIAVIVEQSVGTAMAGVAQCGAMIAGSTTNGPI